MAALRQRVFERAALQRHHVVWIASDNQGLLLLEALRRTPEGRVWASLPDAAQVRSISEYLRFVPELDRPVWGDRGWGVRPSGPAGEAVPEFDRILAWGPHLPSGWEASAGSVIVDPAPGDSSRLTDWVPPGTLDQGLWQELLQAEDEYLRGTTPARSPLTPELWSTEETRDLSPEDWAAWWSPERPSRFPRWLLARDAAWTGPLSRIQEAWPGPRLIWKRSWTIWSDQGRKP